MVWAVLMAVAAGLVRAQGPEPTGAEVVQVGAGIWAVLQPAQLRFNDSNTLFVVGTTGVSVVDAQATPANTARTIAAIRSRTELPVRDLVLTHWHGDHVQGVEAYRTHWPDVRLIAHASLQHDLTQRTQAALLEDRERYRSGIADARERLAKGVDVEDDPLTEADREALTSAVARWQRHLDGLESISLPLPTPTVTYEDSLVIDRDGRKIQLLHARAHTRGDTLVWIEDERVLATGDVLDDLPFGGHGFPTPWIATLVRIEALDPRVIVPGHGRVREGIAHVVRVRQLLQTVSAQVDQALAREFDLERTQAAIALTELESAFVAGDALAQRYWNAFIPALVERVWRERRGELASEDAQRR